VPIQRRRRFPTNATFASAAGLSGFGASGRSRTATALQTRRRFLTTSALAGAAGLFRAPRALAGARTLETTTVRFLKPGLCVSTLYVAEQLLRAEGFTNIAYVDRPDASAIGQVGHGEADFGPIYACEFVQAIDAGERITVLAGVMVGCFELFARNSIGSVTELTGKRIGVQAAGPPAKQLLTLMAAEVGLDARDLDWITDPKVKPIELFVGGRVDAFLGFPPEPQQLRAAQVGHVLVNTAVDRPWSQYFCCMLAGSPDYVRAHPNATRSVLRAVLKAADLCATDPTDIARRLADGGRVPRADYAAQTLADNNYKWREFDPEDTIRWYALRLRETGLIKSTPQQIIANATDWRFLDELKRELKT
jgi:NitT/TauT family transport system substrate-binding protein